MTSVPWGSTNLKLDNGTIISIPRQLLQAQQSQIAHLYKQHCNQMHIDSMSDRTVYSILDTIHASKQKFISGLDDFVKAALDGWSSLTQIIQQLPITREEKSHSNCLLENSKLYLKSQYEGHCGEDERATTHCTIFALSQSNNEFYSHACAHGHTGHCKGMNHTKMSSFNTKTDFHIPFIEIASRSLNCLIKLTTGFEQSLTKKPEMSYCMISSWHGTVSFN